MPTTLTSDAERMIHKEWESALQKQQRRLRKPRYRGILTSLDYASFRTSVPEADTRFAKKRLAKFFAAIEPAIQQLNSFFHTISTIVSVHQGIAGYVWGCLQALIVVASRFIGARERITAMITALTIDLTRITAYLDMMPENERLPIYMKCIVEHYVGFCITALKFFRARTYRSLIVKIFWGNLENRFESAQRSIQTHLRNFDMEARLEGDRAIFKIAESVASHALPRSSPLLQRGPQSLYIRPYPRNARFSGRDGDLESMHTALGGYPIHSNSRSKLRTCVIHGMPGVGKTQLVSEYTYHFEHSYKFIFWINAEHQTGVSASMNSIAAQLGLNTPSTAGRRVLWDQVRMWLERTSEPWLLVFDNAGNSDQLEQYMPRCSHGAVLVTSRNALLRAATTSEIPILPLDERAGAQLLLQYLPEQKRKCLENSEAAIQLSKEVGGLPLALVYLAGLVMETQSSLPDCLGLMPDGRTQILSLPASSTCPQYPQSLAAVLQKSLSALEPTERLLMQTLSMLSPDGVPEHLFLNSGTNNYGIELELARTTGKLANQHLILKGETKLLYVHRLLQTTIRLNLDSNPDELQAVFEHAFRLVRSVLPKQSAVHDPQNNLWTTCEQYQSQVMSLHRVYESRKESLNLSVEFAELLSDTAYYFYERELCREGKELVGTAKKILDALPEAPLRIQANLFSLGAVMRWDVGISERKSIMLSFSRALFLLHQDMKDLDLLDATSEKVQLYATTWSDLGCILADYECYDAAIYCLDLCEAIKKILGDPLCAVESRRNKAQALYGQGRVHEAMAMIPRKRQIPEKLLGAECTTLYERCRFTWAWTYLHAHRLARALDIALDSLRVRKELFGKGAKSTLDTRFLLGVIYSRMKNYEAAIKYFYQALQNDREWSCESRSRAQWHLSKALEATNQPEEAAKMRREAIKTLKQPLTTLSPAVLSDLKRRGYDDQLFDSVVCVDSGRCTVGNQPPQFELSGLIAVCKQLHSMIGGIDADGDAVKGCCRAFKSVTIPRTV